MFVSAGVSVGRGGGSSVAIYRPLLLILPRGTLWTADANTQQQSGLPG